MLTSALLIAIAFNIVNSFKVLILLKINLRYVKDREFWTQDCLCLASGQS